MICLECADGAAVCQICLIPTTFIRLYEEENNSRECFICLNPSPYRRMTFSECGHVVCACCAITISVSIHPNCSLCNAPVQKLIKLHENVIKNT